MSQSQFWLNVEAGMSIPDAVDDLLTRTRSSGSSHTGPWYQRPGILCSNAARGFRFHEMGLQHGPESAFAKNLRQKARAHDLRA